MIYPTDARVLDCSRCGAANRIPIERALRTPGAMRCGRCKNPLLLEREARWTPPPSSGTSTNPLTAPGAAYQHPLDREALGSVQRIPGVDSLLKKLIENTYERYDRLFHQASYIRASESQVPTLHRQFERAAFALGIEALPDLFVYTDPVPNAHAGGVERPYVAISTGMVDMMGDDEIFAVLAHELAHWQCRHVLYKTATRLLIGAASAIATATLGLSSLILIPVKLALLEWDRCSELSADRGMLVATRDPELSLRVLYKLAGGSSRLRDELSLDRFLEQAARARQAPEEGILDKVFSLLQTLYQTHPFPLWRAAELWKWATEGEYLTLIQA